MSKAYSSVIAVVPQLFFLFCIQGKREPYSTQYKENTKNKIINTVVSTAENKKHSKRFGCVA